MLNREQSLAVEKIDGPVMVIAGPGTGKTQILANRIARILELTDSGAQNILCLTFTDAGTVAMKSRLLQFIGNEAHRVSVHTFHSFCSRVIQENPSEFDYKSLQPVTELERLEILNNLALHLDENHPLKSLKGNVGYLVGQLSKLFSWMKKENYSPEELSDLATQYKADIREDEQNKYKKKYKDFVAGDLNMNKIEPLDKAADKLIAGAGLFPIYQQKMLENDRYDFEDMILWVLDLFQKSEALLNSYQEQFHYILVDEFQDTSGSQNKLIEYLTSYWENPNIFVVGDDDQSIYRFQGAEVKNVIDFAGKYANHLYSVVLTQNYRSSQSILDASKCHIDQNQDRLVKLIGNLDKTLYSAFPDNIGQLPQMLTFSSSFEESISICNHIKTKIKEGTKPEEIAVIYRKHAFAEEIGKIMAMEGVPVYFHKKENALNSTPVLRLLTVLKYTNAEITYPFSGEPYLFELMYFPVFNLTPLTCARVTNYIYEKRLKWREFLNELLSNSPSDFTITAEEQNKLAAFSNFIENLISNAMKMPLYTFVNTVVQSIHLNFSSIQTFEIECIQTVLRFVESECLSQPKFNLEQLLSKIKLMETYNLSLPVERVIYDQQGVQFLTAHGSKGLEFEHVYLINCSAKAWEDDKTNRSPYGFKNIFQNDEEQANIEENRRLFYVAMTRAKYTLTLSHHLYDNKGKDVVRSSFLDNLFLEKMVEQHSPTVDSEYAKKLLSWYTFEPILRNDELLDKAIIERYLQSYQLSPSHLNSYLHCATAFYYEQILRVPSFKNKYMSFGTAVHRSLDQLFKLKNEEPENFNTKQLRKFYEINLLKERYVFGEKEFEDFLSLGLNTLTEYMNQRLVYWQERKELKTEVTVERIEIDGVPVKGQLDLMDIDGPNVQVFDFKTGDPTKSTPRLKPPKDGATEDDNVDTQHGGPYWRQMMFYALLMKHQSKPLNMVSGIFEFVEPDEKNTYQRHRITIDSEGLMHMRELIKKVYQDISAHKFAPGCGEETCKWCSFVSKNGNKN